MLPRRLDLPGGRAPRRFAESAPEAAFTRDMFSVLFLSSGVQYVPAFVLPQFDLTELYEKYQLKLFPNSGILIKTRFKVLAPKPQQS